METSATTALWHKGEPVRTATFTLIMPLQHDDSGRVAALCTESMRTRVAPVTRQVWVRDVESASLQWGMD